MKRITVNLTRFADTHGWANRILRVDLSSMRIWAQETAPYVPDYLGARGIAARLCWDEYPEPVAPFAPANPLMVFPGALTGSRSPYSGRTNVCAFSPQASPYPWFTRSSIGAHFGGELKRGGYDGIVVTGAAEAPVRIRIRDDGVSILPAEDLWGLDTMDTLEALESIEGKGVRSLVIGPAGERLSRIATIQAASSSAADQGGFGGVMGSKKLKAISVIGTGRVSLAHPERITSMARALARELPGGPRFFGRDLEKLNRQLAAEGNGSARCQTCTEACVTPCQAYFQDVPGVVHNRKWSGAWFCVSAHLSPGFGEDVPAPARFVYDWQLSRRAAFEMNVLTNRYGLNQFDLLSGIVPWLIACQKAGLIYEMNGRAMDWRSPQFWAEFLRATAYREGLGDAFAEGGWAAARTLDLGEDLVRLRYPGWGQAGHWDGHSEPGFVFPYPYWLVAALQWMADTRDPFNNGHGSLWAQGAAMRAANLSSDAERTAALDRVRGIGRRIYHSPDSVDPYSGYRAKAYPGFYHTVRPVIKDCVPVDDLVFPLIYNESAPDGLWVLRDIEGIGDIEGPSIEYHLFVAGTGVRWSEQEFVRGAERVCTLERALQVRHWARGRQTDEMVLPYFERIEMGQSPFLGEQYGLDREQFKPVMDEFYALHGWDVNGRPTPERLGELGLGDMYDPMIEGAAKARERLPRSPMP